MIQLSTDLYGILCTKCGLIQEYGHSLYEQHDIMNHTLVRLQYCSWCNKKSLMAVKVPLGFFDETTTGFLSKEEMVEILI